MKNELNKYPAFLHHMYNEKFCQKKKLSITLQFSPKRPQSSVSIIYIITIHEFQSKRGNLIDSTSSIITIHKFESKKNNLKLSTNYIITIQKFESKKSNLKFSTTAHCTKRIEKRKNYHENYSIILTPQFSPNLLPHIITIHEFEIEREATYNTHPASYHVEFHDRVATASKRLQHRHPRCFRGCKWRHSTGTLINIR